jgi:hypothetical protein
MQRLGDQVFADEWTVAVGGVDEVHAQIGQASKHAQRLRAI